VARRASEAAVRIRLEQALRQAQHQGVERQGLPGEPERGGDRPRQGRVVGDGLAHERQRRRAPSDRPDRVGDAGRLDVHDSIAEPALGPGAAVVRFVGMEHDDLARHAALDPAAVVERLHARLGDPDGVGVVAMLVEGGPTEPGAQELDALPRLAGADPVAPLARTYKTRGRRSLHQDRHAASLPEARRPVEMTRGQAIAFLVFSVAAAGTPGPSNVLLTATGAHVGVLRGLPCLLGVALGMAVMMFLVALGLGSAILGTPVLLRSVKWCGALVLCWLAWKIATARHPSAGSGDRPVGLVGAAAFQWVNPKSWLVCASAAATFLEPGTGSALGQSALLGLMFLLAVLPSCLPWLAFGAALQRVLRSERAWRIFNGTMGALLAASVILFLR
jgi:threonine/homoserine/homoserine lactone efflux protein